MKFLHVIIFLPVMTIYTIAQQKDSVRSEDIIGELLEEATIDTEDSQIYDTIEYLMQNRIDINQATIKDIVSIPFIDINTAASIIKVRKLKGSINNLDDLRRIEGIDQEIIERISPFITFSTVEENSISEKISKLFTDLDLIYRFRVEQDLQLRDGFRSDKFPGPRQKIYNRFRLNGSTRFNAGFLVEQDPGEKSFSDFTSYFLRVNKFFFFDQIIAGDFLLNFGQGLALWEPYAFSKGTQAIGTFSRGGSYGSVYSSADENQFFRGITASVKLGSLFITPFYSSLSKDASIDTVTGNITALINDGYHRTESELKKEDKVEEKIFGAAFDFNIDQDKSIGLLFYNSNYSNPFGDDNYFTHSGKSFNFLSGYFSTLFSPVLLSGEIASDLKTLTSIFSAQFYIDKSISFMISYRNFPSNYFNIYANSFGERKKAWNESGFYTGIRIRTGYGTFNLYYDQFRFPVTSRNYPFSSSGNDLLLYYTHRILSNTELKIKLKRESKESDEIIDNRYQLIRNITTNIRTDIEFSTEKRIRLRTRFEFVNVKAPVLNISEKGYLLFQEIKFIPVKDIDINGRLIFFRTDSYLSRIYQFENDLPGKMTNPALSGEGIKWYLLIRYKTDWGLSLSFKYSELFQPDKVSLGSGDMEIHGSLENKFSFQADFNF